MRRPARITILALSLIGFFGSVAEAQQGLQLNRYTAANAPEDMFSAESPVARGHDYWAASVIMDYGNQPLVFQAAGTGARTPLIEHQLTLRAILNYSLFDRLMIYGGLPIDLAMNGQNVVGRPGPDESTLSDPWLGARLRVYGDTIDPVAIGLSADVTFPLAQAVIPTQAYSGEQTATFVPKLLVEFRPWILRITGNLGLRLRQEYTSSVGALVRNELIWRLGVGADIYDDGENHFEGIVEAFGNHAMDYFARSTTTDVELLLGVKYRSDGGLTAGLAAGPGLSRGWGTPAARVLFTIGFVQPEVQPEPEPEPEDSDGDGLLDPDDMCPNEAEDVDEFQDDDGCPDLDDDEDGVPDVDDGCRLEAEDIDEFEDEDGCPDLDNDEDGLEDADDQCPNEAEDMDGFEDEDGCPDLDNDEDGVPDADDECPLAPGTAESNGCPQAVRLEGNQIRILQTIRVRDRSRSPEADRRADPRRGARGPRGEPAHPQGPRRGPHRRPRLGCAQPAPVARACRIGSRLAHGARPRRESPRGMGLRREPPHGGRHHPRSASGQPPRRVPHRRPRRRGHALDRGMRDGRAAARAGDGDRDRVGDGDGDRDGVGIGDGDRVGLGCGVGRA